MASGIWDTTSKTWADFRVVVDDASAVGDWGGEPATEESRTLPFIVGMVLCLAGSRLKYTDLSRVWQDLLV